MSQTPRQHLCHWAFQNSFEPNNFSPMAQQSNNKPAGDALSAHVKKKQRSF
jgi:hypothetical protein